MRSHLCRGLSVLFALLVSSHGPLWAATPTFDANTSPRELVQAALASELDGPSAMRKQLLDEALARDPDFAPARWQSGFVRWEGDWLTPEQVAKRAAADPQLAAYRKLRDAMIDRADDHRALARWCHKNQQLDAERVHWAKVLEFDSSDAEALNGLGLRLYAGRLMTRQQIEEAKASAAAQKQATQIWRPKFVKWREAITRGSTAQREAALAGLAEIADPAAIEALEAAFATAGETKTSIELNRALIETVGRIPGREATAVLLRRAVLSDSLDVRATAADELKKRPMHAYVPLLIAALPGKIKTQFHVTILPGGTVLHEHEMLLEGRDANLSMKYESAMAPGDALSTMLFTPRTVAGEMRTAAAWESQAGATLARLDWLRSRVQFVLERTTGFANVNDPQLWEKQYNDYHGWNTQQRTKPAYSQSSYQYRGYARLPADAVLSNSPKPPTLTRQQLAWAASQHNYCFPAGVPVLTQFGPRAIEDIRVGDPVLSQVVDSGELTFAPVQATTVLPAQPLIKVTTGSHSIVTTYGHPFWVVGEGWRVAKNLQVGDRLHGLSGSMEVATIEEARPEQVYNLVVGQSQTYFAGPARLLVHDYSPLLETSVRVPGLSGGNR